MSKINLFIVEGLSDEVTLEAPLFDIFGVDSVLIKVNHGDITSNYKENTASTIVKSLQEIVSKFLRSKKLFSSDILSVNHIVDLDGCYIKEKYIIYSEVDKVIYNDKTIETKNPDEINMRNIVKSGILDRLVSTNSIEINEIIVPYNIYYMSCNLDHVFHEERNQDNQLKVELSQDFVEYYYDVLGKDGFISFMKDKMINKEHNYEDSWSEVKKQNNSLLRYSNLFLCIKNKE